MGGFDSCTDISQGQELLKHGLDASTADFHITPKVGGYVVSTEKAANSVPSWSVVALFRLIPTIIQYDGGSCYFGFFQNDGKFGCSYYAPDNSRLMYFDRYDELVGMLVEVVVWLLDGDFVRKV